MKELSKSDFYTFLVPKVNLHASIVRTVIQSVVSDKSIDSAEYKDTLAICYVHPKDMKVLGIKEGNLKITSEFGEVVVKAVESEREAEEGLIILPLGPWANQISGIFKEKLQLKSLKVKVEVTKEQITDIKSFFRK